MDKKNIWRKHALLSFTAKKKLLYVGYIHPARSHGKLWKGLSLWVLRNVNKGAVDYQENFVNERILKKLQEN